MARPRFENEDLPKVKISKESLRQSLIVLKYVKPFRFQFFLGLLFIALSALSTMSFPHFLGEMVDNWQTIKSGHQGIPPGRIAIWMIGILILQMLFSYMRIYLFTYVGENSVGSLRKDIYNRLLKMPMDFFAQNRVGELSSRLSADATQIQDIVTTTLAEMLRSILTLIIGIALIFFISKKLTLLMLSVVPVIAFLAVFFGKYIRKNARKAQDQLADSGTIVQETLQGIANVKSFANEWYESNRYTKSINSVIKTSVDNGAARGLFFSALLFLSLGTIVLVVWYATTINLSFGDLTKFVLYTAFIGGTMTGFADLYSSFQRSLGATQRIRELLNEPVESVVLEQVKIQPEHVLHGQVSLENLFFNYPSRQDVVVLKDVSLDVRPGQQIAIVGPSGSGKSTLASLLLHFYDVDKGKILYDNRVASTIPRTELRRQMALVPQDVLLFGGTIYENIAYGKPGATEEEVIIAAQKANAHEFINRFPEGYQTIVGERGVKLSGGQRQRIAIARAILKDPVILILDEATSALDSESESLVQEALNNLMNGRTSFVIAHRLSTIRNADLIVVLEDGIIRETGTHRELLEHDNGLYRSLYRLQQDDKLS